MTRATDVLIIGAGAVGLCAAHFLTSKGRSVTLIDRGDVVHGHSDACSYGNAGMIVPSHSQPLAEPGIIAQGLRYLLDAESPFYIKPRLDLALWRWLWHFRKACSEAEVRRAAPLLRDLHLESCRHYAEFNGLLGEGAFSFGQCGRLLLCRTGQGLQKSVAEGEAMKALELEVEVLDDAGLSRIEPNVEFDCAGGVFYPQDGHLDPARFVSAFATDLEKRGAQLQSQCELLGFGISGSRVTAVRTTRGDFTADEVVVAAGSWSPEVGTLLHLDLPIQPAKGYSATVMAPEQVPRVPLMLTEAKVAVTPMGGNLRFAGTFELAGMDRSINRRRVEAMRRSVGDYVPAYSPDKLTTAEIWRGMRPCTPDGMPFLGRATKYGNVTVAAGHASVGMSLAPASGRIVACLIEGEDPGVDIELMRVDRFG